VADLDKLPGLGPTLAARIIDWREANHGFRSIDDLRKVGGIGDKLFAAIRKLVSL
jgi:competence protein ComEA